jgi:O-antigen/teichoic acid export membrane protein
MVLEKKLAASARMNALGVVTRLFQPLLLVVFTRLFGPAVMGIYLMITSLAEMVASAFTAGTVDAMTVYGSHHADAADRDTDARDELARIFATAFRFSVGGAAFVAAAAFVGAAPLSHALLDGDANAATAFRLAALSLPLAAFATIASSAPYVRMQMQYGVGIMGLARPLVLLSAVLVARVVFPGTVALFAASLASYVVVAALGFAAFARHFDARRTLSASIRAPLHVSTLSLAVPQSIALTLDRFMPRLGMLLLAAYGYPASRVAFYGTAVLFATSVRELKLVFSNALVPVAARHHGAGDTRALEEALNRLTRWTLSLVVPVVLVALATRNDVLSLVDRSYSGDTRFVAVLFAVPLISAALGFVGDAVTITGHGKWTLFNAAFQAAAMLALSSTLIPLYGLLGASLGVALASLSTSIAAVLELRALERISLRLHALRAPLLALVPPGFVVLFWGDPARGANALQRWLVATLLASLYVGTLRALSRREKAGGDALVETTRRSE